MDNRGVVNSHGLTRIDTGGTLTNIGSGKIYGDHIALGSSVLNNREENVGGQPQAGSIVARERLDIGAGEINNREGALISSAGTFFVGGHSLREIRNRIIEKSGSNVEVLFKK